MVDPNNGILKSIDHKSWHSKISIDLKSMFKIPNLSSQIQPCDIEFVSWEWFLL